jgi:hypothetical protein
MYILFLDIHEFFIDPQFRYLKAHVALSWSNLSLTGVSPTEASFIFKAIRDTISNWEIVEKVDVMTYGAGRWT